MLTQEQIKEFDEKGFIKGDLILNDQEVELLRKEAELVMSGKSVNKPVLNRNLLDGSSEYGMSMSKTETVIQIVNIWMASEAYLNHAANLRVCEETAQLCRSNTLRIWHDQFLYKPPVTGGPTGWHQDHPAWPIIQPPDLVSAWIALDDATIENGAMWMVPGSHKWGNQNKHIRSTSDFKPYHNQPELLPMGAKVEAEPFEIKKGQVGYHHCLTWHGGSHNRTDTKRRAIAVHYMPEHTYYAPTGTHPMEPHIDVMPGEVIIGDSFPVVYQRA
ncbi:phytanoyl-CoA dioxygenase family protein [Paenibacillus chungangensis]|uniref:Phytanoyl-CoA dioxygenase family protein n=1 Tax=Paenibacillus chungangensis TaxID=696535 RepID=A0ABW3HRP6_9BACL